MTSALFADRYGPWALVARGRGGIILVSSGAGMVGAPNMVAYGATKAFDILMGEALWGELEGVNAPSPEPEP